MDPIPNKDVENGCRKTVCGQRMDAPRHAASGHPKSGLLDEGKRTSTEHETSAKTPMSESLSSALQPTALARSVSGTALETLIPKFSNCCGNGIALLSAASEWRYSCMPYRCLEKDMNFERNRTNRHCAPMAVAELQENMGLLDVIRNATRMHQRERLHMLRIRSQLSILQAWVQSVWPDCRSMVIGDQLKRMIARSWTRKRTRGAVKRSLSACCRPLRAGLALVLFASGAPCQQTLPADPPQPTSAEGANKGDSQQPVGKRLFGIIPNYRTSPSLQNYVPLTTGEKFKIASQDAFDRGTVALAALFGGESQLTNANRSFGQGVAGFGKYWGAAYADLAIGDYMTEGIFPTLLHQDPRYFRRGTGSRWSRVGYAMSQIFWTHRDSGGTEFNYSEVIGNSTAVAISNAYYANSRTAADATSHLGMQIGVDMAGNILKEFWPDLERKIARKRSRDVPSANR